MLYLFVVDGDNIVVLRDGERLLLNGVLDRVGSSKDEIEFFESSLASLREEEVSDDAKHDTSNDEDNVDLPLDLLEGNGPGELVDQARRVDEETLERHTLGTDLIAEDLHGVKGL